MRVPVKCFRLTQLHNQSKSNAWQPRPTSHCVFESGRGFFRLASARPQYPLAYYTMASQITLTMPVRYYGLARAEKQ